MGLDRSKTDGLKFLARLLPDTVAPIHFVLGNPAAVRKAFQTGGASLAEGVKDLLEDMASNGGMPSQADKKAFQLGENLGCTPVGPSSSATRYSNSSSTRTGRSRFTTALFIVPPQINKFPASATWRRGGASWSMC